MVKIKKEEENKNTNEYLHILFIHTYIPKFFLSYKNNNEHIFVFNSYILHTYMYTYFCGSCYLALLILVRINQYSFVVNVIRWCIYFICKIRRDLQTNFILTLLYQMHKISNDFVFEIFHVFKTKFMIWYFLIESIH